MTLLLGAGRATYHMDWQLQLVVDAASFQP
jgi:hypothetical protein